MISWQKFVESKKEEQEEERSGIDVDHDHEKGEPAAHVAKVKKAKEEQLAFFTKRKEGAAKIAAEAKAKGGPSILTYWHFAAKHQPYIDVISAIKSDKEESFFISKCKSMLSRINCTKMSQKDFQEIIGIVEVWGEARAQLFG